MAITRSETQIEWATASSKSVAAAATETSDAFALDATCIDAAITLKADNSGTPASGDIIYFYLSATAGDPDGASTVEYPTNTNNMQLLGAIDTNDTDADSTTVYIPNNPYRGKIVAVSGASSNAIVVSATIEEMRSA